MSEGILKIATCQFAVSSSIEHNAEQILDFVRQAKQAEADIVHFSECALSGYAGFDLDSPADLDWKLLREQTHQVMSLAAELDLWVVLGSTHQLTGPNKPHNSLYLIGPDGKIRDRYDKRFCTPSEMALYTPGDRFVTFTINGVTCALLICFDLRFPEVYRALWKLGVDCVFQSFYNARQQGPSIHSDIMQQSMQCRAATNYFWITMNNSSAWYSPYPSCFIRPDGRIAAQLQQHKDGIMVNTVDLEESFYDPSADYRPIAVDGALTNGPGKPDDERSRDTKNL